MTRIFWMSFGAAVVLAVEIAYMRGADSVRNAVNDKN